MNRIYVAICSICVSLVCLSSGASAGPYDKLRDQNKEWSAQRLAEAETAAVELEAFALTGWDDFLAESYLQAALEAVYFAYTAYVWDQDQLPAGLSELVEGGYLDHIPANPYHGGEPLRILTAEDGFAPGDLLLQICPRECWSIAGPLRSEPRPISFELGIYRPFEAFVRSGNLEPSPANPWAVVPEGLYHLRGLMRESEAKTLANREKRQRAKEAAKRK